MLTVDQLSQWVERSLVAHSAITCGTPIVLTPLAGDAGFRQYFRVNSQPPLLAVIAPDAPGVSESAAYFAHLSAVLRDQGIATPEVLACDEPTNCLLIECFTGGDLFDHLSPQSVDGLYGQALLELLRLQQVPREVVRVPDYSEHLLRQEMALFNQWFVNELLAYPLSSSEDQLIEALFDDLIEPALSQPQVLVHRDYHSRNLICREACAPGVIDFQDAVWGPITYDLVSLLRDCYIHWPVERVQHWAIGYGNMAYEIGLLPKVSQQQFLPWFDLMGLQRHIKVLGIFARLSIRDGKHRYLNDLPLVIHYVLEVANFYPQTQAFASWFEQTLLPLVKAQSWYQPPVTAGE